MERDQQSKESAPTGERKDDSEISPRLDEGQGSQRSDQGPAKQHGDALKDGSGTRHGVTAGDDEVAST